MKDELAAAVAACVQNLLGQTADVELTRPDEQFGDFATNVAFQLAKQLGRNPREIAEQIAGKLRSDLSDKLSDVSVAGPGFINLRLNDRALTDLAATPPRKSLQDQTVVAEYSDPNPFKVLHAGHLYTSVVGDAVANLMEQAGAHVHRVNFGGDVGLHVAKTLWAIIKKLDGTNPEKLEEIPQEEHAAWMATAYVEGNQAYDEAETAGGEIQIKLDIQLINKVVYSFWDKNETDYKNMTFSSSVADAVTVDVEKLREIYMTTRQWSYEYFETFYARIGTKFEKYYPESETAPLGLQTVREQLAKGVYEESEGAVVFDGEKYGLHTRVFINSHGLPTYEAKDIGLIMKKWQDYHFDKSVVITGNDIIEYMKVVLKSIEQFEPELAKRSLHLTHGNVKLAGGVKMSSRKGNILRATDVLDAAADASREASGNDNEQTVLGAVKYAFLKQRIGADIIYDPQESVTLEGNSGPYLQYAHARARSILRKAEELQASAPDAASPLQADERSLLRKVSEYGEVVDRSVAELMPHHVCTYLYELAQVFNRFYEHNRVIGDDRQSARLRLVEQYAEILRNGLTLLGISAPGKM